jgi:hypothetical protein
MSYATATRRVRAGWFPQRAEWSLTRSPSPRRRDTNPSPPRPLSQQLLTWAVAQPQVKWIIGQDDLQSNGFYGGSHREIMFAKSQLQLPIGPCGVSEGSLQM